MSGRSALVVEGGGMRGIFSAGVLDAFLAARFDPFDLAIGASAGACNLASHLAGQRDRNRRCYTTQMCRREFIDPWRYVRGGHWLDLDWLWDAFAREDPLDVPAVLASPVELVIPATSAVTGAPIYFQPTLGALQAQLKGSCALPGFYRGAVSVAGHDVVDAGVGDPIPVREAHARGARRILVIRSRPAVYRKRTGLENHLGGWLLRGRPAVARSVRRAVETYCAALDFIRRPPAGCQVLEVAPPVALETGRTTQDPARLTRDYQLGRTVAQDAMRTWRRG